MLMHKKVITCIPCACRDAHVIELQKKEASTQEEAERYGREASAVVMLELCFEHGPQQILSHLCEEHRDMFSKVRRSMIEEVGRN